MIENTEEKICTIQGVRFLEKELKNARGWISTTNDEEMGIAQGLDGKNYFVCRLKGNKEFTSAQPII